MNKLYTLTEMGTCADRHPIYWTSLGTSKARRLLNRRTYKAMRKFGSHPQKARDEIICSLAFSAIIAIRKPFELENTQ